MEALLAIQELRRIAQPVLAEAPAKVVFPVPFTFRLVLERLGSSLGSLELLHGTDPLQHHHATGLVCRNILSDALITGYLIKSTAILNDQPQDPESPRKEVPATPSATLEERLHKELYALYHDDLRHTDKFVKIFREAGILSEEGAKHYREKHAMPDSILKLIRDYANEFGIKSFPPSTAMIKSLLKLDPHDPWIKELQLAFDIWTYFSKYEHLGWHAYELTRDLNKNMFMSRLKSVARLAALSMSSCLEMLEERDALEESMAVYKRLWLSPSPTLVANDQA
jgi:hypothetical protein